VEVPLLHAQLPGSQRRWSQINFGVLAESLVLCLTSAAIGLALSTILLPAMPNVPAFGLSVSQLATIVTPP